MSSLRLVAIGFGLALLVVGAGVGLWSMTIAPPPPSVSTARRIAAGDQQIVDTLKGEFQEHMGRAATEAALGRADLLAAHALVLAEVCDELSMRTGSSGTAEAAAMRQEYCTLLAENARRIPTMTPALAAVARHCSDGAPRLMARAD